LLHEAEIDLPGPRLPHDIGFTPNYTILHDLPFFHDPKVLERHHLRVLIDSPVWPGGRDPLVRVRALLHPPCKQLLGGG
ncbi:hypothetical protein N9V98_07140, partial [Luminiphilus sp.]|nr:hypothetical protein [Luminiphilus sp.]